MKHPEATPIALVCLGLLISIVWALIIIIQWIAAQLGWWGLLIPSACFTLALFGRALLRSIANVRRLRGAFHEREQCALDLQQLLQSNRREPLVEPREEQRIKPILHRNLRQHFEPNGQAHHERKPLP